MIKIVNLFYHSFLKRLTSYFFPSTTPIFLLPFPNILEELPTLVISEYSLPLFFKPTAVFHPCLATEYAIIKVTDGLKPVVNSQPSSCGATCGAVLTVVTRGGDRGVAAAKPPTVHRSVPHFLVQMSVVLWYISCDFTMSAIVTSVRLLFKKCG